MFCFADATGEALVGSAAPGQRRSQHGGRPRHRARRGRRPAARTRSPPATGAGDDAALVASARSSCAPTRPGAPRASSRPVGPATSGSSSRPAQIAQVTAAIFDAIGLDEVWEPALNQDGKPRDGAAVCELTSLIDDHKLPEGHPADRPARAPAPRRPAQPVPLPRVPLLGLLHRPGGSPRRTRRHHAGPRPRRAAHPAPEGLGALPVPLLQLRGQRHLDDDRHAWRPTWCAGSSCSASTAPGPTPGPRRCAGASSMPRVASFIGHGRRVVRIIDGWPSADALLGAYRRIDLIT